MSVRNTGLVITALGMTAWIVSLEGILRTMDDGMGANIGAGLLLMAGRGLVAVGLVVVAVSVVMAMTQRE